LLKANVQIASYILLVDDSDDGAFFFDRAIARIARIGLPIQTPNTPCPGRAGGNRLSRCEGQFSNREQFPLPHLIMLDLKMPIL